MKIHNEVVETIEWIEKRTATPVLTLTFDAEEAQCLVDVLAKVGGCPTRSRRGIIQRFSGVLRSEGFIFDTSDIDGNILFRDREEG